MRTVLSTAAAALLGVTFIGAAPYAAHASTENWPEVFEPTSLRTLNIEMSAQDWDFIRKDLTETYRPGWFSADDETPIYVAIRRKSSRALPSESNPIKVSLSGFTGAFDGAPMQQSDIEDRQKKLQEFVSKNNQDFAKKLKEEQDKAKAGN